MNARQRLLLWGTGKKNTKGEMGKSTVPSDASSAHVHASAKTGTSRGAITPWRTWLRLVGSYMSVTYVIV